MAGLTDLSAVLTALVTRAGGVYNAPTFGSDVMLWGYLFKDPYDPTTKWRLYISQNFDEYIEFLDADIGPQLDLFSAENPLAGSLVWVNKDVTVRRVREHKAEKEGEFLKGAIARGFLSPSGSRMPDLSLGSVGSLGSERDPGSGGGCGTGAFTSSCE